MTTNDGQSAPMRSSPLPPAQKLASGTSVQLGSLSLSSPVMPASGCFGPEVALVAPLEGVGATVTKTVFHERRGGNPTHRLYETPRGMINSVGIPSPGTDEFRTHVLPRYLALGLPVIASIGGLSVLDYALITADLAEHSGIAAFEVNVSCPNLEKGGVEIGTDPAAVAHVTREVVARSAVPVIIKLSPMVTSITDVARAAADAGASAVTVANSYPGVVMDHEHYSPVLGNTVGGVSGPSIKPLTMRLVWEVATAVSIPVIGCGGVSTAQDVRDYLSLGAAAVQIGTATFAQPDAMHRISLELRQFGDLGGRAATTQSKEFVA